MNTDQKLFDELVALTQDPCEAFYAQDFQLDSSVYRIFNYRLASYTNFLLPGALECRGIMFELDIDNLCVKRLASRPMTKFFNYQENPMTMDLDLSKVDTIELKADGSLMSTYIHNGQLRLKSKGSLFSEQAIDAMKWLEQDDEDIVRFHGMLHGLDNAGWTVNLEWCAPQNRIVIGYLTAHLKVLNARNRATGNYMSRDMLESAFSSTYLIDRVDTNGLNTAAFVQSIPAIQDDIEGYVARIGDLWFKIKTEKYMSLHHAKDSINNPRRLFEAVVDEGVDDLRSMFAHDELAIKQIDEMQLRVTAIYNHLVQSVETYHAANKAFDRKTYAIGAQTLELNGLRLLGLAMNMYLNKDPDFKGWLKGKYKELGFRDTATEKTNVDE
jgi:T4 RnlA family RNA ligase